MQYRIILIVVAALAAAGVSAKTPERSLNSAATTPDFIMAAGETDLFEIEEGKLAASRAQDTRVRQFGQQMVEAHSQTTADLQRAIRQAGLQPPPPPELRPGKKLLIAELGQMQGDEFDHLYLEQQAEAHEDALLVMRTYAAQGDTPALRDAAGRVAPLVAQHLATIRRMQLSAR
jgi:putative membrane protein